MSERYGRTKVSKIRQAYNDLRSAIASGDMEKAQEAFDRYEQWSDYIYGEAKIDTSTEAVEALADRIEELEAKGWIEYHRDGRGINHNSFLFTAEIDRLLGEKQ